MRRLLLLALACASLGLMVRTAHADVPPPEGTKNVRFVLEVENLGAHPDYTFFVFPWSASNGAPTSEVGEVTAKGLGFGKRIMGQPTLYAVKKERFQEARPSFAGKTDLDGATVPVEGAIQCGGPIRTIHTIDDGGPDEIRYRLAIRELSESACHTEERETPSLNVARQPPSGCASCTVGDRRTPDAPGLLGSSLLVAAAWLRRRRR